MASLVAKPSGPVKWVDHMGNKITVDRGTTVLDSYKLEVGGEGWLSDGRDHPNRKEGVNERDESVMTSKMNQTHKTPVIGNQSQAALVFSASFSICRHEPRQ